MARRSTLYDPGEAADSIKDSPADGPFNAKLFQILATLNYNSERSEPLETILKEFLVTRDVSVDIVREVRRLWKGKMEEIGSGHESPLKREDALKSLWFRQDCLLSSNIPQVYVPEYVAGKLGPFEEEFEASTGFSLEALWLFSFSLLEFLEFKKHSIRFADDIYKFQSKKEYADLGFVAIPGADYIEGWKNVITLATGEVFRLLAGRLGRSDVAAALEVLAFSPDQLAAEPGTFRLPSKPILKLDENTLVVLVPKYLARWYAPL